MAIVIPASFISIGHYVVCDGAQPGAEAPFCGPSDTGSIITITGVTGAVVDIYMLITPIDRVYKLRLDVKRKLGLVVILLGGLMYVYSLASLLSVR